MHGSVHLFPSSVDLAAHNAPHLAEITAPSMTSVVHQEDDQASVVVAVQAPCVVVVHINLQGVLLREAQSLSPSLPLSLPLSLSPSLPLSLSPSNCHGGCCAAAVAVAAAAVAADVAAAAADCFHAVAIHWPPCPAAGGCGCPSLSLATPRRLSASCNVFSWAISTSIPKYKNCSSGYSSGSFPYRLMSSSGRM